MINNLYKLSIGLISQKGGGGGGSSGAISYPAYVEAIHADWLNSSGADTVTTSVTDLINAGVGNSPWTGATSYNPATDIASYEAAVAAFAAILAGMVDTTDWAALFTQANTSLTAPSDLTTTGISGISEAVITADVDAFADQLDDEINTKVLPRFRRGMQNIGAVNSSAFIIGAAVIEGFRDRDVSKHASEIRLMAASENAKNDIEIAKNYIEVGRINLEKDLKMEGLKLGAVEQLLKLMLQRISWHGEYMRTFIESKRIKIVANKEYIDTNHEYEDKDGRWDLEMFQASANIMAGVAGGTAAHKQPSLAQSMIGGGLMGGAAGFMMGGPVGAVIGGILGIGSGLL